MKKFLGKAVAPLALLAVLGWAASAHAQAQFPTVFPNINATGVVAMCPSGTTNLYAPCGSAMASPLPVTVAPHIITQPSTVVAVGTGSTGAVVATLTSVPGKLLYLCNLDVSAIGGTATIGPITVAGLQGNTTFTYQFASSASGSLLSRTFTPCIAAKDTATNIVVTTTADGTATAVDVNLSGLAQ